MVGLDLVKLSLYYHMFDLKPNNLFCINAYKAIIVSNIFVN